MTNAGHNSQAILSDDIKKVIDRIENLDVEIKDLQEDKKEVYMVAKTHGLNVAAIKKVISRRKRNPEALVEEDDMISFIEELFS